MKDISVFEETEISAAHYKLRGVVRCHNHHSTCAVNNHDTCKWTYFDDLSVNLQEFSNFQSLREVYREGWFFTVYELWEMPNQCEGIDCMNHRLTTCANGSFDHENKISESAYLSAAKVVHSDKKQRTKRQHSNVLNDDLDSESESSCESKIGHSKSLSGAQAGHSNKKRKMQRQHSDVYGKPTVAIFNKLIYIQFNIYMYVIFFFNLIFIFMEYFLNPFHLICLYLLNLIALNSFNLICLYSFNSVRQNIHLISGTGSTHGIRKIRAWEVYRFTCMHSSAITSSAYSTNRQ